MRVSSPKCDSQLQIILFFPLSLCHYHCMNQFVVHHNIMIQKSYVRTLQNDIGKRWGKIAINPERFGKLITSLRTAVDIDGTLDKEATSYNDIFDAFRLALKLYHYRDSSEYD